MTSTATAVYEDAPTRPLVLVPPEVPPGAPAWQAAHRAGIGGSEVAAILGLSDYDNPYTLYLAKIGELPDKRATRRMVWGQRLEEPIARGFAEDAGLRLHPKPGMLRHPDYPWWIGSPDAPFSGPAADRPTGAIEVKTSTVRLLGHWLGQEAPDAAALQLGWYLGLTGWEHGYVVGLVDGEDIVFHVQRDQALLDIVCEHTAAFWHRVEHRIPPLPGGSEAEEKAIRAVYRRAREGVEREVDGEVLHLLRERREHKAAEKAAKAALRRVENRIKEAVGEAEYGTHQGERVVAWLNRERDGYTVAPTTYRELKDLTGATHDDE